LQRKKNQGKKWKFSLKFSFEEIFIMKKKYYFTLWEKYIKNIFFYEFMKNCLNACMIRYKIWSWNFDKFSSLRKASKNPKQNIL
jgi:ADP-glucose pyrophosphorylase